MVIGAGLPSEKTPKREMKGYAGVLKNDAAMVASINPSLRLLLGDTKVIDDFPTVMGSEDFQEAFAGMDTPYVFFLIGIAPMDKFQAARKAGLQFPYSNHNPDFFVDLSAIPAGTKINTVAAIAALKRPASSAK